MSHNLGDELELYAAMIEQLPLYDDWLEVANLFDVRDWIEDASTTDVVLTESQQHSLRQSDDRLVAFRDVLLRFPEVFEERGAPPSLWWWHLDEGPQVREQALASVDRI